MRKVRGSFFECGEWRVESGVMDEIPQAEFLILKEKCVTLFA